MSAELNALQATLLAASSVQLDLVSVPWPAPAVCSVGALVRTLLPPPIESIEDYWQPHERQQIESMLSVSFIGSSETVRTGLEAFVARHEPDELIVTTSAFDQNARLHSLELLAALGIGAAVAH